MLGAGAAPRGPAHHSSHTPPPSSRRRGLCGRGAGNLFTLISCPAPQGTGAAGPRQLPRRSPPPARPTRPIGTEPGSHPREASSALSSGVGGVQGLHERSGWASTSRGPWGGRYLERGVSHGCGTGEGEASPCMSCRHAQSGPDHKPEFAENSLVFRVEHPLQPGGRVYPQPCCDAGLCPAPAGLGRTGSWPLPQDLCTAVLSSSHMLPQEGQGEAGRPLSCGTAGSTRVSEPQDHRLSGTGQAAAEHIRGEGPTLCSYSGQLLLWKPSAPGNGETHPRVRSAGTRCSQAAPPSARTSTPRCCLSGWTHTGAPGVQGTAELEWRRHPRIAVEAEETTRAP